MFHVEQFSGCGRQNVPRGTFRPGSGGQVIDSVILVWESTIFLRS